MSTSDQSDYALVHTELVALVESARQVAARRVNALMSAVYWEIGRRIVETEQGGGERTTYGEGLIERLAVDLGTRFGRGFSATNLRQMRAFHLAWPPERIQQTLSAESPRGHNDPASRVSALAEAFPLPWSSYVRLLTVSSDAARAFYEREAIHGGWSVRQLRRQIDSQFYERAALSHDKVKVLEGARGAATELTPLTSEEAIRDPYVLEFLDLKDQYSESDLEAALIERLTDFLLELGDDFAFVGRQRRLRLDDNWFRVDLVFFHRRLRCLVIIDLLCVRSHNRSSVAATQMWPSSLWRCWIGDIALVRGNFITHKYFDQRKPSRTICHVQGDRACHQQIRQQHWIERTALSSSGNRNIVHLLIVLSLQHRMESNCNIGTHKFYVANLFPY